MTRSQGRICLITTLLVAFFLLPLKGQAEQAFEMDRFISFETCADCHVDIADQWRNSMHHLAHKDPVYLELSAFLRKGLTDQAEIDEAESCVKCHTPVGYVTGFPKKRSDDLTKTPKIAEAGVQCDLCHSAVDIEKMYNNGLVLEPGHGEDDPGIKRGPFDDSEPDFHEAAFSKIHTRAEICGTCHDVNHVAFGTPLETTYTEWKNSPYNSSDPQKYIPCQGCHMHQRPGIPATGSTSRPPNPGTATDYSKERPHIFTHYFVGANAGVPKQFGDEIRAGMAKERLQHAAIVKINPDMAAQGKIEVTVTNTGAGHCIPTGLSDLRQVWLEVQVTDKNKKMIFSSGMMNNDQTLPEGTVVFRTVFGDDQGNAVINIAKARKVIFDNRIKPKESVTQTFSIKDFKPVPGVLIKARLLYRGASQKVLNLIEGKKIDPLPVVEMAADQRSL